MTTDPDAYDSSDPRRPIRPLDPNFAEFLEPPITGRPAPHPVCISCDRESADVRSIVDSDANVLGPFCTACELSWRAKKHAANARRNARAAVLLASCLTVSALFALWMRRPRVIDVCYPPRFLAGDATPGWHRVRALLGRDAVIEVDGRVGLVTVGDRPELRSQVAELLANDEAEVLVVDDPFDELRAILARQAP